MKILINCFDMPLATEGSAGAGKSIQGMIEGLSKKSELSIICSKHNSKEYQFNDAENVWALNSYDELNMPDICANFDIYFNPSNRLMPFTIPKDLPIVTIIHDLQHNHFPHFFSNGAFEARNREYGYALARSDGVIAISNWEKRNFVKYFQINHVRVVHHAPYLFEKKKKNDYHKIDPKNLTDFEEFYLYPAVPWIHKNHYRLIEAISLLNKKNVQIKLVLTGAAHADSTSLLDKKVKELNCEDYVQALGYVSDDELISLMSKAKGMIFPSLYEGFGIPIVDAMNFELPVIASNLTAIPEVTAGSIEYFNNPFDSYSMAEDIQTFVKKIDSGLYDIKAAKNVGSRYSIERLTTELLNFFGDVISSKNNSPLDASFSTRTIDVNKESRKITIIIEINDVSEEKVEFFLHEFIKSANQQIFDYALIIPYEIRNGLNNSLLNQITKSVTCAYYQNKILASKVIALEHLLEISIKTDYLLFVNMNQYEEINYSTLRKSISFLDNFLDLFSVIESQEPGSAAIVKKPEEQEDLKIKRYNEALTDPEKIIQRFYNRLIRTRDCKNQGMIGTLAALSKDITAYSNMHI